MRNADQGGLNSGRAGMRTLVAGFLLGVCILSAALFWRHPRAKKEFLTEPRSESQPMECQHTPVFQDSTPPLPSGKECEELADLLSDPILVEYGEHVADPQKWNQVVVVPEKFRELASREKTVVPHLIELLKSQSVPTRRGALLLLIEITHREFGGVSLIRSNDPSPDLVKGAYKKWTDWWNKHCRLDRFEWLAEVVFDRDDERSKSSLVVLSESEDIRLASLLRRALGNSNLRPYAIEALIKSGCQDGTYLLYQELKNTGSSKMSNPANLLKASLPEEVGNQFLKSDRVDIPGLGRWLEANGPYLYFNRGAKRYIVDEQRKKEQKPTEDRDIR